MRTAHHTAVGQPRYRSARRILVSTFAALAVFSSVTPGEAYADLFASVLPSSRSAEVGTPVTAFATIINTGPGTATGCSISPGTLIAADFLYQTTDPATNALTGTPNTPVDIAEGASQSFVFAFTPTAPFAPVDVQLNFGCTNTSPATSVSGLNTLLLSASATAVPDIVALAATTTNDGIVGMSASSPNAAFAVATVNVGNAGASITASADTGAATLPLALNVCETNPATGACISAIGSGVTTTINTGATPTFGFFLSASGPIPLDPANNRVFVRFTDSGGTVRGSSSVAVSSDVQGSVDVTGTYTGTGSAQLTNCQDPADNINIAFNVVISIPSQSGQTFSGTATLTANLQGFALEEINDVSGTIDAQGAVSGTLAGDLFVEGFYDSSSEGTFSGTLTGDTLSYSFVTHDTVGDTCTATGSATATR